jgi:hypothetical protein
VSTYVLYFVCWKPAVVEREGSEVEVSPTPGAHTWAMLQNGGGGGTYGAAFCCFVLKWEIGVVVCVCVGGGGGKCCCVSIGASRDLKPALLHTPAFISHTHTQHDTGGRKSW